MHPGDSSSPVLEMNKKPRDINLAPSDSLWTTHRDGAVKLRMEETGPGSVTPITAVQLFQDIVQSWGPLPALVVKRDGVWEFTSYLQYYDLCRAAAKSFLKLGLERFHSVGILGFNSPEWFIANIGAIMAGGFAVGMYTTSSAEACLHVATDSDVNILVVEDHQQLLKILQVEDHLPHLKAIVQYNNDLQTRRPGLYTWKEFMQLGSDIPDSNLDDITNTLKSNQCCTVIYTSGTTGPPKGVMLSHDNITWVAKAFKDHTGLQEHLVGLSYLPLSHVGGMFCDIWFPMCFGGTTYFANPDALKGSLVHSLKEVRPIMFPGVPRVWEKIQETLEAMNSKRSASNPSENPLIHTLVLKKIRAELGLDRCDWCYSIGAPIRKDTKEYFMGLNIPLMEVYGMSESTGPHIAGVQNAYNIHSCGKMVSGCKTRIHMPDKDGTGELCFWGRNVFMGYLNMEEKTAEALDGEGWLHTGDLGKLDQDGFVYVTGRIKELVITSGGENIPPVLIEDTVKKELPIISNAMLVGDYRKFLSMLLTLKCIVDVNSLEPKDDLTPDVIEFFQQVGSNATRVSEVVNSRDPAIYDAIQKGIDRVNQKATSNAQKIQKWTILSKDFWIGGGELGPTIKMKRPFIMTKYQKEIDELYMA
ncbi:long-chain-fatty-acid--CoA ligase ACSBG2-like [Ambystoma mexicanum]|uniref:long-chain-fatty-acid--CoA ligase ACSBG2-like n=1 Tax=Ambystoma mexicanum TaxID=8296 RepID=UPI0037E9786A